LNNTGTPAPKQATDSKQPTADHDTQQEVLQELAALRREIQTLNRHRFIRIQNSLWRFLLQSLLRGMAMGLGTVIGASILVSGLLYMMSHIDFLPIIGDWSREIADEIRESTGISGPKD
jgi:hypothetical protein